MVYITGDLFRYRDKSPVIQTTVGKKMVNMVPTAEGNAR